MDDVEDKWTFLPCWGGSLNTCIQKCQSILPRLLHKICNFKCKKLCRNHPVVLPTRPPVVATTTPEPEPASTATPKPVTTSGRTPKTESNSTATTKTESVPTTTLEAESGSGATPETEPRE